MIATPKMAMILAAGLGERMRPLTDHAPKPLLEVGGKAILRRLLEQLQDAGVEKAVVNVHHLAEQIEDFAKDYQSLPIVISDECNERLETGGGVKKALPLLGNDPFFTLNGDAVWIDGKEKALTRMARAFNPDTMDVLLLLCPMEKIIGSKNQGDYFCDADGRARWRGDAPAAPCMFASVTITNPALYKDALDGAFSQKILWDKAERAGRLHGLVHDGEWLHVSTPGDLETVNKFLS